MIICIYCVSLLAFRLLSRLSFLSGCQHADKASKGKEIKIWKITVYCTSSGSSHKCIWDIWTHTKITNINRVSRGHRRSTVQSPCWVRWTDWWVTVFVRGLVYNKFSRLPVERAVVEVVISLTGRKAESSWTTLIIILIIRYIHVH